MLEMLQTGAVPVPLHAGQVTVAPLTFVLMAAPAAVRRYWNAPARASGERIVRVAVAETGSRIPSYETNQKALSQKMAGVPSPNPGTGRRQLALPPNWLRLRKPFSVPLRLLKKLFAANSELRL